MKYGANQVKRMKKSLRQLILSLSKFHRLQSGSALRQSKIKKAFMRLSRGANDIFLRESDK
ncbi:hypothetical protein AGMMS49936_07070 [Endomicrobiia bacterium]|nr:hypothetical protein AGMMS49936_07070 [Endomicrobiia bacterium]